MVFISLLGEVFIINSPSKLDRCNVCGGMQRLFFWGDTLGLFFPRCGYNK
jgi:hypothetical protein